MVRGRDVRYMSEVGLRVLVVFFFQAEDGIRDLVRSRGLGDVYKRQPCDPRQRWRGPRIINYG